jgi:DNA polymerase-3 subunit epsilon
MREILFDTETTGLSPAEGHRVVEVACVELVNLMPTGRELQFFCNPERDMPEEAERVHGLSAEFLSDKPLFAANAQALADFFGGDRMVAHNAPFDIEFLKAEFARCGLKLPPGEVIDTLPLARRKFPGAQASLEALCRRLGIDLSERTKHGALVDTRLLAKVYLELRGGSQPGFELGAARHGAGAQIAASPRVTRVPRPHAPTEAEIAAHRAMVARLKDPIWDLA